MSKTKADLQPESWSYTDTLDKAPSFAIISQTLADLADEGHPIVVGTADLKYSNGLFRFEERHPDRFFQFGISEQNMISAAAGMASTGLKPHVATFASFMALLACEQIRTDIAYTMMPVRLIGTHTGIAFGFYGTSHHATEDLAIMRSLADMNVVAPADGPQFAAALRAVVDLEEPIYFRIGRGRDPEVYGADATFELGKAIVHEAGTDITLIATGSMVYPTLEAAKALRAEGLSVGVIDMHTIKPLDAEAILKAAGNSKLIMTVEEHNVLGGLGGAVAEVLSENGTPVPLHRHGIKDTYVIVGPPTHLYKHYGLDADGIAAEAKTFIAKFAK
jgi:transketolase